MTKKSIQMMGQRMKDWTRDRWHSVLHKMSRGAANIAIMMSYPRGENWRRQDKHQKTHDARPHKCHKYK